MTRSTTPHPSGAGHIDRGHRSRTAWWPRRRVLSWLFLVLLAVGLVCVYEEGIWHISVDRVTFVAYDVNGKMLVKFTSINAQDATNLRQQINALPPAALPPFPSPPTPGVQICLEPLYSGPIASYRYEFFSHGFLIEKVWSESTQCAAGWASSGGVTNGLFGLPVIPKGVHIPAGPPAFPWPV